MSNSKRTVQDLFDLTNKVAIVTGGCGHLGVSLGSALAEAGATVIITSRDKDRADAAAKQLPYGDQAKHFGIALNQMDSTSLPERFADIIQRAGKVDILVNNAYDGIGADLTNVTAGQFGHQLGNATAYFLLARLLRNHAMERHTEASVIMIGSMYGMVGSYPDVYEGIKNANPVAYQTLKGGIIQMTRHLAVYWARDGVRVNCLSPGPFPSHKTPREIVDRLCAKSPMRRMGIPHELKGALLLLASAAGSYITGQNILVDGGWTAW